MQILFFFKKQEKLLVILQNIVTLTKLEKNLREVESRLHLLIQPSFEI